MDDPSPLKDGASLDVQKRLADMGHAARLKGVPRAANPYQDLSDVISSELVDVIGHPDLTEIERTLAAAWWRGWDRVEPGDLTCAGSASVDAKRS